MTEPGMIEAMARAMCKRRHTSQCAAICLSRFASDNRDGKCPDAVRIFGPDARAALDAIREHVAIEPETREGEDV